MLFNVLQKSYIILKIMLTFILLYDILIYVKGNLSFMQSLLYGLQKGVPYGTEKNNSCNYSKGSQRADIIHFLFRVVSKLIHNKEKERRKVMKNLNRLRMINVSTSFANNEMNPAGAAASNFETNMAANSGKSRSGHADMRQDMVNLQA